VLSAKLFAIALNNRIEYPAPGGSKKVWSDDDGKIDLIVLLRNPRRSHHVEAHLYELKPNNPSKYQSYISEVEHYINYIPPSFEHLRRDRAMRGKILHFVWRVAPKVFDPIVFLSPVVDVFINFWPAMDDSGPVDGLVVYEWGFRVKPTENPQEAREQHIEAVKRLLRVQSMTSSAAQQARSNLLAADLVLAFFGIGLLIGIGGAIAYPYEGGAIATVSVAASAATAVGATGMVAVPTAVTGAGGVILNLDAAALVAASTKVANDVASLAAGLLAYFVAQLSISG